MSSCTDGTHAKDIIARAVAEGRPWFALADTNERAGPIQHCGMANTATLGRFFQFIGQAAAEYRLQDAAGSCEICKAHSLAIAAGLAAYRRIMDMAGGAAEGKC